MTNPFCNWKTSSIGYTMVGGSLVHLVFACLHGKWDDEQLWTVSIGTIGGGFGLIFARDASASQKSLDEIKDTLAAHDAALRTGDTSQLAKPPESTKP